MLPALGRAYRRILSATKPTRTTTTEMAPTATTIMAHRGSPPSSGGGRVTSVDGGVAVAGGGGVDVAGGGGVDVAGGGVDVAGGGGVGAGSTVTVKLCVARATPGSEAVTGVHHTGCAPVAPTGVDVAVAAWMWPVVVALAPGQQSR